ncbi:MAG: hypothetical protein DGJ47_000474 [Rickettsiaceae bacterium]
MAKPISQDEYSETNALFQQKVAYMNASLKKKNFLLDKMQEESVEEIANEYSLHNNRSSYEQVKSAANIVYQDIKNNLKDKKDDIVEDLEIAQYAFNNSINSIKSQATSAARSGKEEYNSLKIRAKSAVNKAKDSISSAATRVDKELGIDRKKLKKRVGRILSIGYKLATAPALWRVIGIASSLIFVSPLGFAAGIGTSVLGTALDTIRVSKTRRYYKDCKALINHRNELNKQDELFLGAPEIKDILSKTDKFYTPSHEEKKSSTKRYNIQSNKAKEFSAVGQSMILHSLSVVNNSLQLFSSGNIIAGVMVVYNCISIATTSRIISNKIKTERHFKKFYNAELDLDGSPGFNNPEELETCARTQKIQRKAVKQTILRLKESGLYSQENGLNKGKETEQLVQKIFAESCKQFDLEEKSVYKSQGFLNQTKNLSINFLKALNPLSIYHDTSKMKKKINLKNELEKQESRLQNTKKVAKNARVGVNPDHISTKQPDQSKRSAENLKKDILEKIPREK